MRSSLQMIDAQIGRGGLPVEGLNDLKNEVDNLRLRLWSIMAAGNREDAPQSLERYRLRRALEINSKIAADLERGAMSAEHPEVVALEELLQRFSGVLAKARRN
ncbi:MAG TPA: hypothetical protein VFU46_14795 [Gemmatimonadales bacterium]|nr:hypothetical protein [Gemmatimonadales bacterium]